MKRFFGALALLCMLWSHITNAEGNAFSCTLKDDYMLLRVESGMLVADEEYYIYEKAKGELIYNGPIAMSRTNDHGALISAVSVTTQGKDIYIASRKYKAGIVINCQP